ncbi:hypothetical protein SBOR_3267 [Sclerotinia borealis F-4128]|uniref:5'-3' DNA helicase ZGRF1-like N-terminal domain-containing protein n=1 Tax=Sclerotinia borealis (strain F-4128) TaxID=1432307 RepID=W9CPE0_SCLBF|nr:hypothetical protein SBOR_3267 [Sclerotinia borealis F-4128]
MTASASVAMSMDVPPDQNTAPVLEFRCLYTADTRRKQKRWQDGRLKYHTFNKRIMVFDDRSNLVGDAHWRENAPLDEGAELELERNGILVEVSEFLERKDQDLTELIDKRVKEREERFIARNGDSSPARSAAYVIRSQSIAAAHLKPRPLNSILGTPSGHYGKALVPNTSLFEQRKILNASNTDENESPRPTKRRKANEPPPSKSGFAQNLMGATLSFTPTPSSTGPVRYESLKLKSIQRTESNDNEENGDNNQDAPSSRNPGLVGDMTRETNSSRNRIQSRKRDKPEKSGYASNLTGASLSLSSFREVTPKNIERTPTAQKTKTKTIDLSMDTSSDEDGPLASIPKAKEVNQKKKKPRINSSEQIPRLSSPPAEVIAVSKPAVKPPSKRQESRDYVSPVDQPPERSHSSLRIKSRPRTRMLMFMDQSGSRSSPLAMEQGISRLSKSNSVIYSVKPPSNSGSSPLAVEKETTKSVKLNPVLPVARSSSPLRLSLSDDGGNHGGNDFENDDGNDEPQTPASLDDSSFGDFEEHAFSPPDVGINHQMIDAILSRTRPPEAQEAIPKVASVTEQRNSGNEQLSCPRIIEGGPRQPEFKHFSTANETSSRIAEKHAQNHDFVLRTSPGYLRQVPVATKIQNSISVGLNEDAISDRVSKTNKDLVKRSEPNVGSLAEDSGVTTVSDSTRKPNTPNIESVITPNPAEEISVAVRAPASASCALQPTSVVSKAAMHFTTAGKRSSNVPVSNPVIKPPKAVAENGESDFVSTHGAGSKRIESEKRLVGITPNGYNFSATSGFMTKLMSTPNQKHMEAVPIKTTPSLIDQPTTSIPVAQPSEIVEFKQSPTTSPDIFPTEQTRSYETSGFMSANQIVEKEAQSRTLVASNPGDQGLSRPRLTNPATRRISIQKTAERTLHALAPAVNHMGPPAAIFGGLGSGSNTTSKTSAKSVGDSGNQLGGKGPWSRESFDLFGSWRAPVQLS